MTGHQNNADEAVAMKNLARQALIAWGVEDCDPVLLKYRENVVFRVVMPSGLPAALRIHRFGYQSDAALRLTAIISAATEIAISSGEMAPISKPMGA